jgi:4-hydroxybenzoate polyprenyltransferase
LFIIGLIGHGTGYILNEIVDIPMDSRSMDLKEKPLVKGTVSVLEAKAYVWIFAIAGIVITPFFFPQLLIILLLYLSFFLGISYALLSKRIPGMEIVYALWAVTFTLVGALSVGIGPTNLTMVLLLMMGVIMFFNVAVIGGLKDIVHDPKGGGRTTAWSLGVRARNKGPHLPFPYFAYMTGQLFIFIFITIFAPWIVLRSTSISQLVVYYTIVFFIDMGIVLTIGNFTHAVPSNRKNVLFLIRNYVILSYLLVPAIFILIIPIKVVLFIAIFPILWAIISNVIVYGKTNPTI